MKLLFVMNSARYFVVNRLALARTAQMAGYEVHAAVCPDDYDSIALMQSEGIHCHPFCLRRRGYGPVTTASSLLELRKIFLHVKPDLVHAYTIKSIVLAGALCRFHATPFVALIAGRGIAFSSVGVKGRSLDMLATNLYREAFRNPLCRVCFQNPEDRALFLSKGICTDEQAALVGSGVDIHRFAFTPYCRQRGGRRNVLFASRMLRNKGVLEFLEAANILKDDYPDAQFVLVGAPDIGNPNSFSAEDIRRRCAEAGATWLGYTKDMPSTLSHADIFCLPTYYPEGIPMTLMQAAAMGKAIVASDTPGCREVIENERTGLLVPPGDSSSLTEALRRYLTDSDLCHAVSLNARERIEDHFHEDLHHQRYLNVYNALLRERSL